MSGPAVPVDVVRVRRGRDPLPLPRYMTSGAAGMDLLADVDADVVLGAGERRLVPTGLTIAIPAGFEGQVRPRSGLAVRDGVTVLNGPGTIDSDYRGEVQVLLVNLGAESVRIRRGDRVAQLVVAPVTTVILREVDALPASERGVGGFGSTDARGTPEGKTTGAQRAAEGKTTGAQRAPEEKT